VHEPTAPPLASLRVVDLSTGIAGAYATKLLADAGADVLHVEPPGGDPLRSYSASGRSLDEHGDGVLFRYLRASQRSAVLDLATSEGRDGIRRLCASADLVFESFAPGELGALGLGWDALREIRPQASLISITPFGQTGPFAGWPANEFTLQAWSGCLACRGRSGFGPVQAGGHVGDPMGGACAAVAALAAQRRAERSGFGSWVDLALLEVMVPTFTNLATVWGSLSGIWDLPPGDEIPSVHPTRDGYVGFCIFTGQQWQDFTVLIEQPELRDQPDLSTMPGRIQRGDEIRGLIDAFTQRFTTDEVAERAELLRIPVAPIGNGASLPRVAHFRERESFARNPRGGFAQPRVPYRPQRWEPRPFAPAPTLGELGDVAFPVPLRRTRAVVAADCGGTPAPSASAATPLSGLRVLDLTAFWAGPHAGLLFAALGADVIHVESVQRPDGMRMGSVKAPTQPLWYEWGPTFHAANLGKRSLALDLTRPRGIEILTRLIAVSDVVIENFSPRVMEQFGLGAEAVAAANPRAVYVRMPAFGLGGPWRDRVGFAQTMEQMSGVAWLTGYADASPARAVAAPMNARGPMDPLAGTHAVFAALLGLAERDLGGRGGMIESVMAEIALNAIAEPILEYDATGELLGREGNRSRRAAPQGVYACRAAGSGASAFPAGPPGSPPLIAISIETDDQFRALCDLLGRDDWARDAALRTPVGRRAEHDALDAGIAAWCSSRNLDAALDALLARGMPAAPVVGSRRGIDLAQLRARAFFEEVEHSVIGRHAMPRAPWRFRATSSDPTHAIHADARDRCWQRPAPRLGEHSREILRELLGASDAELDALEAERIIGTQPIWELDAAASRARD
jgi:crotonobetainyl-CoA:carnitine CoA-transferase CaiB-like acyl-CoA transferase